MKRKLFSLFAPVLFVVGGITGCVPIPQGSTVEVPVQGVVWDAAAQEYISINGDVHLLSQSTQDGQSQELHVNYQGLKGIGENSNITYQITGAGNSSNGTLTVQPSPLWFGPQYPTTIHVVGNHTNSDISVTLQVSDNNGQYSVSIKQ